MHHLTAGPRLAACLCALLGPALLLAPGGASAQSLSLLDGRVVEGNTGNSTLLFEARLSAPAASRVSFNLELSDGSATAPGDYASSPWIGVLSIPAGATSVVIPVPVKADSTVEPSEYFNARLFGVLGATVADPEAKGLILDDDGLLLVSAAFDPAQSGVSSGRAIPRSAMSRDGRYVAFASDAPDLVANGPANGQANIYVRDTRTGLTVLASPAVGGGAANGSSSHPSLSDDGRYLVFESAASNLVAGDLNEASDVFLRDLSSGTTTLVSAAPGGGNGNAASGAPVVSGNGRHVAFHSLASNLVAGDTNGQNDVFVRDVQAGNTQLVSVKAAGTLPSLYGSESPSISADGRYIAFVADALLVEDTWQYPDIYRRDMQLGVTQRVSVAGDGGNPDSSSREPVISADGRFVVFESLSSNLGAPSRTGVRQLYRRDMQAGTTTLVSVDASGNPVDQPPSDPSLSADGRLVAFRTQAKATADDANLLPDIFVRDMTAQFTTLASKAWTGGVSDGEAGAGVLSADGRFLTFEHSSAAILPGDSNQESDLFQVALAQDASLPVLTIADTATQEADTDKSANLVVSLSAPATQAVSFDLGSADGSALAGTDYSALALANLSIAAGQSSLSVPFTVRGDDAYEPSETFTVLVGNVRGARVSDPQSLHTITNDDTVPVVPALSIADASLAEGNAGTKSISFTVTLSAAPTYPVVFDIATSDGSARAGSDYVALSLAGQQIPAGQTTKTFAVTINGDAFTEINETFNVNVTNVGAATVTDGSAIGTITNDDPGPTLSINDASVVEGNNGTRQAAFTVTLSAPQAGPVSFDLATADGSAKAGSDYVGAASNGMVIAAGATTASFTVTVNGDTEGEADETFTVNLTNSLGAGVTDGQGLGTILNDDTSTLSVADVAIVEGQAGTKQAVFTVRLSDVVPVPVSFDVATANGTATAGSDFLALSLAGQVIPAGQTSRTVSVTVQGDTGFEPDETFVLNLSNVTGAPVSDGSAIGTILNDDPSAVPRISIADATVREGNTGTAALGFRVSLSAPASGNVAFKLSTRDHLAFSPVDYTAQAGTAVTIPAGQTAVVVKVPVRGDTTIEANETLFATLHDLSGEVVPGDLDAIGQILNDDGNILVSAPTDPLELASNGATNQAVSTPDGRYVAFTSKANNLGYPLDRFQYDVYRRDTLTGTTELVSRSLGGGRGGLESSEPSISDDGRYVSFISFAPDLVANDNNGVQDLFRRDMLSGVTELVSITSFGTSGNDFVLEAAMSGNGRWLAFRTAANDLLPEPGGVNYLRDMQTRVTRRIPIVSGGIVTALSNDGRHLVFYSTAGYITPDDYGPCAYYDDPDSNQRLPCSQVYWHDTLTGETQFLNKDLKWPSHNLSSSVSDDGRWVSFTSDALSPRHIYDALVRDTQGNRSIYLMSIGPGGQRGNASSFAGRLSPDGSHLAFASLATNMADDGLGAGGFVRRIGGTSNARLGVTVQGMPTGGIGLNRYDPVSRLSAGISPADDLAVGDDNGAYDVFIVGQAGVVDADAELASLTPSSGALGPAFSPATRAYSMTVVADTIRLLPTTHSAGAKVTVNGKPVASGSQSEGIALAFGANRITVEVTAADKVTRQTTTVDVTRVSAQLARLSISDAKVLEGNAGTRQLDFTVSLSAPAATNVVFGLSTSDRTARASIDYLAAQVAGQVIPAGSTSKTVSVTVLGDTMLEADETFAMDLVAVSGAAVGDGHAVGTLLNDDSGDGPILRIADAWATEGYLGTAQAIVFKLSLSTPAAAPVSVDVASYGGSATPGLDFDRPAVRRLTIPAGESGTELSIDLLRDELVEDDETFRVVLSHVDGALLGDGEATGTIIDDDGSSRSLAIRDISVMEGNAGSTVALVTATLSRPSIFPVTFDVALVGATALEGVDFDHGPLSDLQIPVGATSTTFAIEVLGDSVPEWDEYVQMSLENVKGAAIDQWQANLRIMDDDSARLPELRLGDARLLEGNNGHPLAVFPVVLSEPSPNPVTFSFSTSNESAVAPADYSATALAGLVIPPGSTVRWVRVPVNGDTDIEPEETFAAHVTNVVGAKLARDYGIAEIVNDDSEGAEAGLSVGDVSITEGDAGRKSVNVRVSMGVPRAVPTYFDIATSDGSASEEVDYLALSLQHQEIPAGQTSVDFAITIKGDVVKEPDETFTVTLSNNVGSFIADPEATVTLLDEESGGADVTPELRIADIDVAEGDIGDRSANVVVALSAAAIAPVSFDLAVTGVTAIGGIDYAPVVVDRATIPAGETRIVIPVAIHGDADVEAHETFRVTASHVTGASVVDGEAVVTIFNDDGVALPTLSVSDASVVEGNIGYTLVQVTVSLSAASPASIEFDLATADGLAREGYDYHGFKQEGLTLEAGQVSRSFTFRVIGEEAFEADEFFNVEVTNVAGARIADGVGKVAIVNDDFTTTFPVLTVRDAKILEGNDGVSWMEFKFLLSHPSPEPVAIFFDVHEGTARSKVDYYTPFGGGFTLQPGQIGYVYRIPVIGDNQFEEDEKLYIDINRDYLQGVDVLTTRIVGTIVNDDPDTPIPELSINDVSVNEGDAGQQVATFTVSMSERALGPVTFDLSTEPGTAMPGVDFASASAHGLAIPAGQTSVTFAVPILGDTDLERNETFTLNLANPTGATVRDGQGLGTIVNDDAATLSIADASVVEGNGGQRTATFVVTLSRPLPTPVTFDVYTRDGTATAGSDYVARSQVGRLIDAGRTRAVFEVNLIGDSTPEGAETFEAVVGNVFGATVADGTAVASIQDDDSALVPIAAIQGSGVVSPLQGQPVTTEGVVTALTSTGFYLQSADGEDDGDPATSEGLFVSGMQVGLKDGDRVRVRGRVEESFVGNRIDQLTVTSLQAEWVSPAAGNARLPAATAVGPGDLRAAGSPSALERLENMRVTTPALRVVAPSGGTANERGGVVPDGRFFGVLGTQARPFREPGLSVLDPARTTAGAGVPVFDANPERLQVDSLGQLGAVALSVDTDDRVDGLVGVLGYGDGSYRLLPDPTARPTVRAGARPRAVRARGEGQATVGFLDLRGPGDPAGQASPATETGAYALRLAKTAHAVCAFMRSPDILAVSSGANGAGPEDLSGALRDGDGNVLFPGGCRELPDYRVARPAGAGRAGFLLQGAEVRPGVPRVEALSVASLDQERFRHPDGSTEALFDVPPTLLLARINDPIAASMEISVLSAGLSPLGDDLATPGAHGWRSRGDYVRARRAAQAATLARAIQDRQRRFPAERLVVLGNFESHEFGDGYADLVGVLGGRESPPERVLQHVGSPVDPPLTNLMLQVRGDDRYTASRDGNAVALDHVLVSRTLVLGGYHPRLDIARVNADFGEDNGPDAAVPLRVSDHDPVVLYLDLPSRP